MKKVFITALIALSLLSCKKEEDNQPQPVVCMECTETMLKEADYLIPPKGYPQQITRKFQACGDYLNSVNGTTEKYVQYEWYHNDYNRVNVTKTTKCQ